MTFLANRYEVLGELGKGGNGTVYRVRDHKIGRDLALKLLGHSEEVLAVREAHVLTALESPNILRVFNVGVHNDVPFIATDIAALGSTENQIEGGRGAAPELAMRWMRDALVGLDYCHRRGVLHRDLTPGNVFLDRLDHARLGDFGLAVSLDEDGTAASAGNQRIRAPEGYGGRLSALSDVFSAGTSLWRLLTGSWPFDAETEEELLMKMTASSRPRLRDAAPHVHRSIAAVVESALAVDPSDRPRSAAVMGAQLADCQLHARRWKPTTPAEGIDRQWSSDGGGAIVTVAVEGDGNRHNISTRHAKSGRAITAGCMTATHSELNVKLRRIFDTI